MNTNLLIEFLCMTMFGGVFPIAVILLALDVMKEKLRCKTRIHMVETISLAVLDIILLADVAACIACLFAILF